MTWQITKEKYDRKIILSRGDGQRNTKKERKKILELHAQSATTSQANFAVIGVQLCSTITGILVVEHFLIQLNSSRFSS